MAKVKIDVDITVLDNDGSGRYHKAYAIGVLNSLIVLAASLICSTLALSSAGVEMVDLPVACSVVRVAYVHATFTTVHCIE